jgi:predicted dehydrogenase
MEFEQGAVGTIITSFATRFAPYDGKTPIAVFGTEGTLLVPDPNVFGGPVKLRGKDDAEFRELPLVYQCDYGRSIGLADMAYAIRGGRAMRASGEQAMAVLDLMLGFLDSSREGKTYKPVTSYTRPAPMAVDLAAGVLDE